MAEQIVRYAPHDDPGDICKNPLCFRFDVQFDTATIKVTGIDLFDPDSPDKNETWLAIIPPFTPAAQRDALKALKRTATDGIYDFDCIDEECECKLAKKWSNWSEWGEVEISGGFSLPAPAPPPPRVRYRANGTVSVRSRMKIGTCYRTAF